MKKVLRILFDSVTLCGIALASFLVFAHFYIGDHFKSVPITFTLVSKGIDVSGYRGQQTYKFYIKSEDGKYVDKSVDWVSYERFNLGDKIVFNLCPSELNFSYMKFWVRFFECIAYVILTLVFVVILIFVGYEYINGKIDNLKD